jgi:purine-binding chemotaxis protein CheW
MTDLVRRAADVRGFCTFRVQERLYGMDLTQVREISTHVVVTPVPPAPPLVRGLVNLRSRIYLVLDSGPALGLPPTSLTTESRMIVLQPRIAEDLGLLVERGGDIVYVASDRVAAPAVTASTEQAAAPATPIVGVGKLEHELMMIIDPVRLVATLKQELG